MKIFQKLQSISRNIQKCDKIKIGVLGVPFNKGQRKLGVENGPKCIREKGLFKKIAEFHPEVDVYDYGDIEYKRMELEKVENMLDYSDVISCNRELSQTVSKIIKDGRICITLGGDHSIGLGTVDGHIKSKTEEVALIWVDAHADINTNTWSGSGNMHGMPLAMLIKEMACYWQKLPGMDWLIPTLRARNIAYIGLRSVDTYERRCIEELGITAFGMESVEQHGINRVVNMALDKIDPLRNKSIHVSFDIDSLDVLEAPSTGTPVRGGLLVREGIHIMETIKKTGRLSAMDLVEVNPNIGNDEDVNKTVDAAHNIILAAIGYDRRGVTSQTLKI